MTTIRVLRIIFFALGACLCVAWFGVSSATEHQLTAATLTPAQEDEGLLLIKSDTESVILELRTPSYEVDEVGVDGVVYQVLAVAGYGQTGDVGQPQLPLKGTLLGIPPAAEFTLNILEVEEEIVVGQYDIYPVPRAVFEHDLAGDLTYAGLEFVRSDRVYSSDAFYPTDIAETGSASFIGDQRVVDLRLFPFQYNPVRGELRQCRRIRVELSFSYPRGRPLLAAGWEMDGSFDQVLQNTLLNYDSARNWRTARSIASSEATLSEQDGATYKVFVDQDGIHQLTYTDLSNAGIDVDDVDPSTFKLHNQGQELAIHVADENDDGDFDPEDYVVFYGQRMTSMYTDTNVYWLSMGGGSGLRMGEKDGTLEAGTVLTYFQTTARWEEDKYYQSIIAKPDTIPSEEEIDHWFGGFIAAFGGPASEGYTITLRDLAVSPPYSATVRGSLHGYSAFEPPADPDHHTRVYLNGLLLDDATWDGQVEHQFETDVAQSHLIEGSNTISVECSPLAGVAFDIVFANWFEIDYRRTYTVENDSLLFDGDAPGTWCYQVGGFSTDDIEAFDVTDALNVSRIVSSTIMGSGAYTLTFEDAIDGEHHYLALAAPEQYRSPLKIVEDTPSNLKDTSNGAAYLIITHRDFYDAALALRDHRIDRGVDTVVVDVEDVYDEFNNGIFDPHAIRDFLTYAYDYCSPRPSHVLLLGDGDYDFRDNRGFHQPNYIPPYLVYTDEWVGEAAADNRYVCVSGDDILPDMYLGRLPARTAAQASAMVSKIINYEQNLPEGDWRQQLLFVADNPDDAGDFRLLSDDIADNHVPSSHSLEKVYYGVPPTYTTPVAVKNAIITAFGTGPLLINYVGHASYNRWGSEAFLTVGDVESLPNSQVLPMMLPMCCLEGYFIHPSGPGVDNSCLGETLVRAEGRGAIASWSPTSDGVADGHHYLQVGFYDAVFVDGVHQIGPAALLGKLNLYYNAGGSHRELIDTYILFGDPAMRLAVRRYEFLPLLLRAY